jgi:P4 family phage/plasmid primase-like protien
MTDMTSKNSDSEALASNPLDPYIPTLDRLANGWPLAKPKAGEEPKRIGSGDVCEEDAITDALAKAYDDDRHFTAYATAVVRLLPREADNGKDERAAVRLTHGALADAYRERLESPIQMVLLVADVDDPIAHAAKVPARTEWREAERLKLARLRREAPGFVRFETRGGYRLLWALESPFTIETPDDAAEWSRFYSAAVAWIREASGIECDGACKDWTRLYRLPNVRREGHGVQRAALEGELSEAWPVDRVAIPEAPAPRAKRITASAPREVNANDPEPGDPAIVEPLTAELAEAITPAWLTDGRQEWFLAFLGWLLGKGWARAERAALLDLLEAHRDESIEKYRDMNERTHALDGPNAEVKAALGDAFEAVDAIVNRHPNAHPMGALAARLLARSENDAAPYFDPRPTKDETRSDLGNARRLVRMHGRDLRYCAARARWYVWRGNRWEADSTGAVERAAKESAESLWEGAKTEADDDRKKTARAWALKSCGRASIANAIELAKSEPGIPVTVDMLDADPWLLNVANGVLDLRTGELHAPDRGLLMTKMAAVAYVPGARSPLWDAFVSRLTGGDAELAAYIQRAMGYALFGAWREKLFWFGYGPPDGGKSTFLGVVSDVLGDYAVSADASTWMVQHNTGGNRGDVTRLLGARLVTTLEVRANARFDQQLMKAVTGGDALTAAAKYEHEIQFRPTFALWFGANDRPIIPDDDEGFWNRVRCVPFTHPIPAAEQDKALREKLTGPEHAPAVLAWLVEGCLAWQRAGVGTCAAVEAATRAYRRDMNQAAGFFDECCELTGNPADKIGAKALRTRYERWCDANGVRKPLQGKAWRSRLLGLGVTGGDDDSREGAGERRDRQWFGLRFRAD